jgi:hypothetical protein
VVACIDFGLLDFYGTELGCEPRMAAQVEKRGEKESASHRYAGRAPDRAARERIIRERLMNQRYETHR